MECYRVTCISYYVIYKHNSSYGKALELPPAVAELRAE